MPAAVSLLTRMCTVASEISISLAISTKCRDASRLRISIILRLISSSKSDGNCTTRVHSFQLITIHSRMVNNPRNSQGMTYMPCCTKCKRAESFYYRAYSGEYLCKKCFLHSIEGKVARTISKYSMIGYGDKVAVGVSGGKDSLSLLYVLKVLF